jgi:hypothetical protein
MKARTTSIAEHHTISQPLVQYEAAMKLKRTSALRTAALGSSEHATDKTLRADAKRSSTSLLHGSSKGASGHLDIPWPIPLMQVVGGNQSLPL